MELWEVTALAVRQIEDAMFRPPQQPKPIESTDPSDNEDSA